MFERFTDHARQVIVFAQDDARELKHNYIGTEHLLLGLLRDEGGVGARALSSVDIRYDDVRTDVGSLIGQGDEVTTGQIPFTPRAKSVLDLGRKEAVALGHDHYGAEHILLGIVRQGDGVASRIILDRGADEETVRANVMREIGVTPPPEYETQMQRRRQELQRRRLQLDRPPIFGTVAVGAAFGLGILVGWAIWH